MSERPTLSFVMEGVGRSELYCCYIKIIDVHTFVDGKKYLLFPGITAKNTWLNLFIAHTIISEE